MYGGMEVRRYVWRCGDMEVCLCVWRYGWMDGYIEVCMDVCMCEGMVAWRYKRYLWKFEGMSGGTSGGMFIRIFLHTSSSSSSYLWIGQCAYGHHKDYSGSHDIFAMLLTYRGIYKPRWKSHFDTDDASAFDSGNGFWDQCQFREDYHLGAQ